MTSSGYDNQLGRRFALLHGMSPRESLADANLSVGGGSAALAGFIIVIGITRAVELDTATFRGTKATRSARTGLDGSLFMGAALSQTAD